MVNIRETELGKYVASIADFVDWSNVDNEFALRVKENYDSGAELEEFTAYAYGVPTVLDMFISVVTRHWCHAANTLPGLFEQWRNGDADCTFPVVDIMVPCNYKTVIDLGSRPVARTAAFVISGAFSQAGIKGYVRVVDSGVYLLTEKFEDCSALRSVLDRTGYTVLQKYFGAKRFQVFLKPVPQAPALCVPMLKDEDDLVKLVPDTFTHDHSDDSKVLVVGLGERTLYRDFLGVYEDQSTIVNIKVVDKELYHQYIAAVEKDGRPVIGFPTTESRNLAIVVALSKRGMVVRSSWSKLFSRGFADNFVM